MVSPTLGGARSQDDSQGQRSTGHAHFSLSLAACAGSSIATSDEALVLSFLLRATTSQTLASSRTVLSFLTESKRLTEAGDYCYIMSNDLKEENTPDLKVDESPISPLERRNSLEKHLQMRPEAQDLKNRHILLDTNAAP